MQQCTPKELYEARTVTGLRKQGRSTFYHVIIFVRDIDITVPYAGDPGYIGSPTPASILTMVLAPPHAEGA